MPRRYKRKQRRRKKGGFSKGNGAITRLTNPSPLPNKFKAVLRYSEPNIRLNPGVGTLANQVFCANGLYDPDITNIGHQPLGWDQLIAMYDHAVVIGTKIKVTFSNRDATYAQICGIDMRDGLTVETDARVVIESGTCNYVTLGPKGSSRDTKTITYSVNPNKFLGRSKPMADPHLKNSNANNPTEKAYFHIFAGPLEAVDSGIVDINVLIEYQSIFIESKPLALS